MSYLLRVINRFCTKKQADHIRTQVQTTAAKQVKASFNSMLDELGIKLHTQKQTKTSKSPKPIYKQEKFEESQEVQQPTISQPRTRSAKLQLKLKKIKDQRDFQHPQGKFAEAFYKHHQEIQNKIAQQNEKIVEQFLQGERKIERRPIDPKYIVKLEQIFHAAELQQKQKILKLETDVIRRDSEKIAQQLQRNREQYQNQQEGDVEAFWQLVSAYPGSRLGPSPHDDPEYFYKYIKGRIPASIKEKYRLQTGEEFDSQEQTERQKRQQQQQQKEQQQDPERDDVMSKQNKEPLRKHPITFRSILESNRFVGGKPLLTQQQINSPGDSDSFLVGQETLPTIPPIQVRDYQSNWQQWILWQEFKLYYQITNFNSVFTNYNNLVLNSKNNQISKPLGSLYNYYRTLPKFLQQHEGVKTVYLGLQYKSPEWSISQKQQALNQAAYICLPLDEASDLLIQQHFQMDKYRLSPYEVDRIFNIKPEFTYEVEDFFHEIKQQKLRGQKISEERKLVSVQYPERGCEVSEAPSLPVDYYQNDDGFWNSYIKNKSNSGAPVMRGRNYLKH